MRSSTRCRWMYTNVCQLKTVTQSGYMMSPPELISHLWSSLAGKTQGGVKSTWNTLTTPNIVTSHTWLHQGPLLELDVACCSMLQIFCIGWVAPRGTGWTGFPLPPTVDCQSESNWIFTCLQPPSDSVLLSLGVSCCCMSHISFWERTSHRELMLNL